MKIIDEVFTFNMVDSKDDFNSSNFNDKQNKFYFPLSYELWTGLFKIRTLSSTPTSSHRQYDSTMNCRDQRAYKERVANLAPVADWLSRSWPKIGPVEAKM